ncbi:hypothetical protein T492DRAFT_883165, partial [Pavlovales sp. CCMP2436]
CAEAVCALLSHRAVAHTLLELPPRSAVGAGAGGKGKRQRSDAAAAEGEGRVGVGSEGKEGRALVAGEGREVREGGKSCAEAAAEAARHFDAAR